MHYDDGSDQRDVGSAPCPPLDLRTSILNLTHADVLPKPILLQALTDAYFNHVYPFYPVVDRDDLNDPGSSIMLQQAVCLAGSLMQHDVGNLQLCRSQYEKVKTLIHLNYEEDNVTLLKTLCLLTCYSVLPTDRVTFDGPWHWLGMAIRLAVQLGLHKDSTYRQYSNPGCLRRLFWYLVNADRLATSCWGRPSALGDWDVSSLAESDFTVQGRTSLLFLQTLSLSETTGHIAEMTLNQSRRSSDPPTNLVERLCSWVRDLPQELKLHSPDETRQPFWRPAIELHILYFATLILLQLLDQVEYPWRIGPSSLAAASCIARLYEEIHYREETAHLLQIHGFFCMVAAVPLICYPHTSLELDTARNESIDIICRVLGRINCKYGGSEVVLRKVRRLRQEIKDNHHRVSADVQQSHVTDQPMVMASSIQTRRDELFPFPRGFCGALETLNWDVADVSHHVREAGEEDLGSAPTPLFYDNFMNLADVLSMDYSMLGSENGYESLGLGL
ncbi:hypothetical protein FSARC_4018 [Fusarium sarcochroum]|uniref:Xylanolytic transcriptional activator regulatory domain-containing protein n=1 Tax=Fusarium sarcochroum TaxID=1208366 RepID=A0A8H4XB46_9HYPO|nr:hypothetical protein FSARC_4018 [Fusarium sarcochroum]